MKPEVVLAFLIVIGGVPRLGARQARESLHTRERRGALHKLLALIARDYFNSFFGFKEKPAGINRRACAPQWCFQT